MEVITVNLLFLIFWQICALYLVLCALFGPWLFTDKSVFITWGSQGSILAYLDLNLTPPDNDLHSLLCANFILLSSHFSSYTFLVSVFLQIAPEKVFWKCEGDVFCGFSLSLTGVSILKAATDTSELFCLKKAKHWKFWTPLLSWILNCCSMQTSDGLEKIKADACQFEHIWQKSQSKFSMSLIPRNLVDIRKMFPIPGCKNNSGYASNGKSLDPLSLKTCESLFLKVDSSSKSWVFIQYKQHRLF